jgi:hypothetical protein
MAETTTTTTTPTATTAKRTPAKRSSTARKRNTSTRSTSRSTTAKSPSKATGRRQRTIAGNETRQAAKANARAVKTTAKQGGNIAERAALVYVGATLEARDRALGLVKPPAVTKLERRGKTTRDRFERDVRKARTRLERELRTRRRDAERLVRRNRARVEREVNTAERRADRRSNPVADQIARVETGVQAVGAAGERFATTVKDRVSAIA